jgi:hypothetical protein
MVDGNSRGNRSMSLRLCAAPEAVKVAWRLGSIGVEPGVVPLARAMDFAPGTALFGKALPVAELKGQLRATPRISNRRNYKL